MGNYLHCGRVGENNYVLNKQLNAPPPSPTHTRLRLAGRSFIDFYRSEISGNVLYVSPYVESRP